MAFIADVKDPLYEALAALTRATPPETMRGIDSTEELTDEQFSELQDWASNHVIPHWSTGLGLIDAAEMLVKSAIENANIDGKADVSDLLSSS
ncbi:hypothetical protein SH139x_004263 [Planctomycetaceae bacterium SH139]